MEIVRTTFQAPQLLLYRLKVQAAKEQTDVSRLLCKAAEAYLAEQEHRAPSPAVRAAQVAGRKKAAGYARKTTEQRRRP